MKGFGRLPRFACLAVVLAIVVLPLGTFAQQVGSLDLTQIQPRRGWRRPPAQSQQEATGSKAGVDALYHCGHNNAAVAGSLQATLVWLDRDQYQSGDQQKFEIRIQNTGSAPIEIPFSPHSADLQPADAGQKWAYSKMTIGVWIGGARWSANIGATVDLFGADDHPSTMLALRPGEWAEILGQGEVRLPDSIMAKVRAGDGINQANARVSLYQEETLVTSTKDATVSREVCVDTSQGPSVAVRVNGPPVS